MTVGRTEKPQAPEGWSPPRKSYGEAMRADRTGGDDGPVVKRHRPGIGSYEDPADERRQKRRPGKTGRPGR